MRLRLKGIALAKEEPNGKASLSARKAASRISF
jgi:hypothetical protein